MDTEPRYYCPKCGMIEYCGQHLRAEFPPDATRKAIVRRHNKTSCDGVPVYQCGFVLTANTLALVLTDFRGNSYIYNQELEYKCDEPDCLNAAVRLPCNAEDSKGRTHHHGGIHRLDLGPGTFFCEKHGLQHLLKNHEIILNRKTQNIES